MIEIPLTKGMVALIDDEDLELISKHKWAANKGTTTYYAITYVGGGKKKKILWMHRLILDIHNVKDFYNYCTDHINHDGLDNQKNNLRICTYQLNQAGQRPQKGRSSIYKGVCWVKKDKKWRSSIKVSGVKKWLGYYKDEWEAAIAYNKAATLHFGEYSYLNKFKNRG